jgi:hypothetical protein
VRVTLQKLIKVIIPSNLNMGSSTRVSSGGGPNNDDCDLELNMLHLSTGEQHAEAKAPKIHVHRSHAFDPYIDLKIVGDNLVLVVTYPDEWEPPADFCGVYDWRTGVMKMVRVTTTILLHANYEIRKSRHRSTRSSPPPSSPKTPS